MIDFPLFTHIPIKQGRKEKVSSFFFFYSCFISFSFHIILSYCFGGFEPDRGGRKKVHFFLLFLLCFIRVLYSNFPLIVVASNQTREGGLRGRTWRLGRGRWRGKESLGRVGEYGRTSLLELRIDDRATCFAIFPGEGGLGFCVIALRRFEADFICSRNMWMRF